MTLLAQLSSFLTRLSVICNDIRLIKSKKIVSFTGLLWGAIVWGSFHWLFISEIELERLALTVKTPDPARTLDVYKQLTRSRMRRDNLDTFIKLGQVLERTEQEDAALDVWRRIVTVIPEDRGLRTHLVLSLHNAHHYEEAETHFVLLLRKGSEIP